MSLISRQGYQDGVREEGDLLNLRNTAIYLSGLSTRKGAEASPSQGNYCT